MLAFGSSMRSFPKLFGARVRALREEQQLRVIDVAALIGCDASYYYSIERGDSTPSFELLMAIAKSLKVDEADLFTWPGTGIRHDLRELVRQAPNALLPDLRTQLDEWLPPRGPTKASAKSKPPRR
jgi:transcriptional regulator with XRE-family HTH domain